MKKTDEQQELTNQSNDLNYVIANRISCNLYNNILKAYGAVKHPTLDECLIFCVSHLATAVNLSICNTWLSAFGNLYIIPKKGSLNKNLLKHLKDPARVLQARTRENFESTINQLREKAQTTNLPIILIDIGGYFSPYIDQLQLELKEKIKLVIEDTANGHQRYNKTQYIETSQPFLSLAYVAEKMAENVMVAHIILSSIPNFIDDWSPAKTILVIGYGRIGRSLCAGLKSQGAKKIYVLDCNISRLFMASTEGFKTIKPSDLRKHEDFFEYCFSMSGGKGTTSLVISALKNHSYLTVATSYDDEFDEYVGACFLDSPDTLLIMGNKNIRIVNSGRPLNLCNGATFDSRNLSLHFVFSKIFSACLQSLGFVTKEHEADPVYAELLNELCRDKNIV